MGGVNYMGLGVDLGLRTGKGRMRRTSGSRGRARGGLHDGRRETRISRPRTSRTYAGKCRNCLCSSAIPSSTLSLHAMATRPPLDPLQHALHPTDDLLVSALPLPPNPSVAYAKLAASNDAQPTPFDVIETARRALATRTSALLDRILARVSCGPTPTLHLFLVVSREMASAALDRLSKFQREHPALTRTWSIPTFGLY